MTTRERILQRKLARGVQAYDHAEGAEIAVVSSPANGGPFKLGQGAYNPPFNAQIQVQIDKHYYTEAAGVFTEILPAAVAAPLRVQLPFFLYAQSDFEAGYTKLRQQYPVTLWAYGNPLVAGKDFLQTNGGVAYDANVLADVQNGDVILQWSATSGGTNYVAIITIRSSDVAWAKLMAATNSNLFRVNMLRYGVADNTAANLAQYRNAIAITNETMFGKFTTDTVNPNGYKNPEQQQENIIDIDIKVEINKEKGIASYSNYDVVALTLNLFIDSVAKL